MCVGVWTIVASMMVGEVMLSIMLEGALGSGGMEMFWSVPALLVCFPLLDGVFMGLDTTFRLQSL